MILIIGGAFSGRHEFLAREGARNFYEIQKKDAFDFFEEISVSLKDEKPEVQACLSRVVERLSSFDFVVATEVGCGVVPVSEKERKFRDANGKLNQALAKIAEKVVLCVCGIPKVIKGEPAHFSLKAAHCTVFRHGQTLSNVQKRFAGGGSDVPLSEEGKNQAVRMRKKMEETFSLYEPAVKNQILFPKKVFSSPMTRALTTARILFPESKIVTFGGLCEMKMGLFENMTHEELSDGLFADGSKSPSNARIYQDWLDSNGTMECPSAAGFEGESIGSFSLRVSECFSKIRNKTDETIVIVAHGGVQMAICELFFKKARMNGIPYFKWQTDNSSFRFGEIF
ncbi:MAG: bifunctional adenosylcobinamide kinase/adenosylcobinamide-phosphate guanylyltransferase [Treponema sp.]|nr:bifunctional adenosylcobinamide kinase/adenosylcobinamide-phosphate guanylyltransferase [Treponema sp.]